MAAGPIDLDVRRALWEALTGLFLDTETRWSVPSLGRCCAASALPDEELDEVFWCEVFPLCIGNLLVPVGEWAALAVPERALLARAGKRRRSRFHEFTSGWMVRDEWTAVKRCAGRLRAEPASRWLPLSSTWDALGRRFFDEPARESAFLVSAQLADARDAGVDVMAEWAFYQPLATAMLLKEEPVGPRVAAVVDLLGRLEAR